MAAHYHCLLFCDARLRKGLFPKEGLTKGYTLFYHPNAWRQKLNPDIIKAFTDSGFPVIQEKVTLSPNTSYEAIEIIIAPKKVSLMYCNPEYERFLASIFLGSRFKVTETSLDNLHQKSDQIHTETLGLIRELLTTRVTTPLTKKDSVELLLTFSIKRGHNALFQLLVDLGADVNKRNNKSMTLLHIAAGAGNKNVAKFLIERGANVNTLMKDKKTPLHVAMASNQGSIAAFLIEKGSKIHAKDKNGGTPLTYGSGNSLPILKKLVQLGASIDVQTIHRETLLLGAMQGGRPEVIRYILSLQPNPNLHGNKNAFYHALLGQIQGNKKYIRIVEQMLEQGFTHRLDSSTALDAMFNAIYNGQSQIVEKFLDNGANVNREGKFQGDEIRPLFVAIRSNREAMVRLLLNGGADIDVTCYLKSFGHYYTPLHYAIKCASRDVVKVLFEARKEDQTQPNLLHGAIKADRLSMVEFLLHKGFDPNSTYKDGKSCVGLSLEYCKNNDVINALVRFGARCTYSDYFHFTWIEEKKRKTFETFLSHCFYLDLTQTEKDAVLDMLKFSEAESIVARHIIRLHVLNPDVDISGWIDDEIYAGLGNFKEKCETELVSLGEETIPGTLITFRDLLTSRSAQKVARYARNASFVKAMKSRSVKRSFPVYTDVLKSKFEMGMWLRNMMDEATPGFRALVSQFSSNFPDVVIDMIFGFLDVRDFLALQKFRPKKQS